MARLHLQPRSQLGASAPAHMCCADGRAARAAVASPVRAPCTLAVQPICVFTAAICPGLLNVCSQKCGQMKKKIINGGENTRGDVQGGLHKCDCHHHIHSRCQEPSWMGTSARTEEQAAPLLACFRVSITLAKSTQREAPSSSLIAVSSLSYLGSFLSPTPTAIRDQPKQTASVLRAPVSFHPVTLCRANHSLNVLTVKLLLSLLFSTKFSHNNPPVIFFTNKIYE